MISKRLPLARTRIGSRMPLLRIDSWSSPILPSSQRAWWGLGSILSMGIMRIRGPKDRAEMRSTKWPSCFMATDWGRPDFLAFCTAHQLLGDFPVLLGADRIGRVGEDGFFIGRALLELDALRDESLEELV